LPASSPESQRQFETAVMPNRHARRNAIILNTQGETVENLIRRLDLTSLRMFVDACKSRSIAGAAAKASVVPSAVSRRIGDLEKSVGVPLLYRSPRGIAPTAAGETVLLYAGEALAKLEEMSAALSRYSSGLQGTIRLVANLSSIDQYLPEDIAAFCRTYPEITVDIDEKLSNEIVEQVESGAADLGVGNEWYLGDADVISRLYRSDELVVIFPKDHTKASLTTIKFSDVLDEPLLGLHANSAYNAKLTEQASLIGRCINFKIRVTSFDALCRMAHAGLGIAIIPRQVAEIYLDIMNISLVPLTDSWSKKNVLVSYKSDATLTATARLLLDFLTREKDSV
jgi:DNA-binding transcriptional LysR family regulator